MYTAFSGDKRWGLAPLTNLQLETPNHLQYSHYFRYHIKNLHVETFLFFVPAPIGTRVWRQNETKFSRFLSYQYTLHVSITEWSNIQTIQLSVRVFLFWRHLASVPSQKIKFGFEFVDLYFTLEYSISVNLKQFD